MVTEGKAGFRNKEHTRQSGSNNEKLESSAPAAQPPKCPECTSQKVWRDGLRYPGRESKPIQRYLCRSCGFRFSESTAQLKEKLHITSQRIKGFDPVEKLPNISVSRGDVAFQELLNESSFQRGEDVTSHNGTVVAKNINNFRDYNSHHRVCAADGAVKNLAEVESRIEKWAAGATTTSADVKGKFVEFAWKLKKDGLSESTIILYTKELWLLVKRGADIFNPDSVKEIIARQKWGDSVKHNVISAYTAFLKVLGQKWEPPKCEVTRKLPFIPTEKEIDDLIAGCGKKTATFLQLLKETAMRSGEADRLFWINIDFERRLITLNEPEKRGNPRIFNVTSKLIDMLNALPRTSQKVFGDASPDAKKGAFYWSKKRLAAKLQNPRLMHIHFHTLRHWKATMLYHQTKDILLVKEFLGHRDIKATLLYIQLEKALFKEINDEFTVRIAKESEEIKGLLEVGFEYVCEKDGLMFFRKRK